MWAKQSTAATLIVGPILDSTGAEYTSAVIGDLSISKNGGTLTALAAAATLTHIANGQYTLVMTTGNMDTLGRLQITCNKSTYQMPPIGLNIVPAMVFDSMVLGTDVLQSDVTQFGGTAGTFAAGIPTAVLDSASVNAVADQVWDEAYADHNTAGSFGKLLNTIRKANLAIDGTVSVAVTPTTLTFSSNVAATTSAYAHAVLLFTTGALAGENSPIISYTNTNGVFLLEEPLTSAPSNGDEFVVIAGSHVHSVADIQSGLASQSSVNTLATYVDTEVAAIKVKTDNLPADPADASDISASFSAVNTKLDTIDDFLDTEIAAIKAKTDNLPADPADQSLVEAAITAATSPLATPAQVNAQVLDVLSVDTFAELSAPPAATSSLKDKITWLFMYARNKVTQTALARTLYRDDTTTVAGTSATSDNGTTFTKGEDA